MNLLVSKLIDNRESLSEKEIRSLADHMASDSAFAEEVIGLLEMDNQLSVTISVDRQNFIAQVHQSVSDSKREMRVELPVKHESLGHLHFQRWRWVLGLAASVLIFAGAGVGAYFMNYPAIAVLTSVSGEVFVTSGAKTAKATSGMRLLTGANVVVDGKSSTAVIVWKDGSLMRLDGNSMLTLLVVDGQKRCLLAHGDLKAKVLKQEKDKPLIINAPYSQMKVLGTSLRVTSVWESTELSVVEGKVSMERLSDGKSVDVSTRHSVNMKGDDSTELDAKRFYWADRFSGSKGGKGKAAGVLVQLHDRARFKGK